MEFNPDLSSAFKVDVLQRSTLTQIIILAKPSSLPSDRTQPYTATGASAKHSCVVFASWPLTFINLLPCPLLPSINSSITRNHGKYGLERDVLQSSD